MKRGVDRKEFPSPVLGEGSTPAGGWVRGIVAGFSRPPHPNPLLSKERGTTNIYFLALVLLIGLAAVIFLYSNNKPCANFNEATLKTPTQTISLALANTPEKQSKGLGGCKNIPQNSGMYFPFSEAQTQTFWMKNMLIPIDIIWLKHGQVVGIEKNVPHLPLNTSDGELPRYTSPVPVDAVLEVGAGKAGEYGLTEGAKLAY